MEGFTFLDDYVYGRAHKSHLINASKSKITKLYSYEYVLLDISMIYSYKKTKFFSIFCNYVKSNYLNLHKCKKYEIINLK
ncbi:hypothetical protein UABAM_00385 [Candidatus Uabimicrobium amorphum]|uniref:Uncharacterized protein n=1 Tax=Uabimicrobium amorphum TaxID=2596890 RepID=A0A5S9IIK3_UABAM|nr:hypothetical protein UABAM_00385 [Candidatus Uabimicrobium amorphum]